MFSVRAINQVHVMVDTFYYVLLHCVADIAEVRRGRCVGLPGEVYRRIMRWSECEVTSGRRKAGPT